MSVKEKTLTAIPGGEMPVLALRGLVIFPEMMLQFDVGRKKSVAALKAAMEQEAADFSGCPERICRWMIPERMICSEWVS